MDITKNNNGKFLYKYLPYNHYSLQILITNRLWLSSPDFLNDPFEGDFIIENYKEFYNDKFIKLLLDNIKTKKNKEILYNIGFNEMKNDPNQFLNRLYEYLNNTILNKYGTTSFSKRCDNVQLWSHYADSHKGFVIIFDRNILASYITKRSTHLFDVEYTGLPKLEIEYDQNLKCLNFKDNSSLLRSKLNHWKSEKEVRILKHDGFENVNDRLILFPKESIKGIIWGFRMPYENWSTISSLIYDLKMDIKIINAYKNDYRDKILFNYIPFVNSNIKK